MAFAISDRLGTLLPRPRREVITTLQTSLDATDRRVARPRFATGISTGPGEPHYRGPWRLPGPDSHRLADESLRSVTS